MTQYEKCVNLDKHECSAKKTKKQPFTLKKTMEYGLIKICAFQISCDGGLILAGQSLDFLTMTPWELMSPEQRSRLRVIVEDSVEDGQLDFQCECLIFTKS